VLVTNSLGSVMSSNALLTVVLTPPVIVTQPSSLTNVAGTTAIFTVTASGTLPLSYQWRKNGSAMTDGGNVSGSSTNLLTLINVQDTDAASYTVVVTNIAGSVTSSVANLVVFDPPIILSQPTNLTVTLTSNATFSVIASGSPVLSYQWNFNGTNIAGATNTALTLTNVQLNQAGSYAVLITNNYGSILSSNAVLSVIAPPSIIVQPSSRTNIVGTTANFSVTASGTPPLNYQWNFGGTNIANATNTTLTLTNVQLTQAGNYAVLVTNNYGSILSSNALLTVNPAPTNVPVITSFSPQSGGIGTAVNIIGLNFDPTPGNNTVHLGAVRAVVSAASTTNLVVSVPAGATYAPITETVNGLTAYAPSPFLPTFPSGGVLTNSSLGSQIVLPTGSGPGAVIIADLDGDGKPDLAVNNGSGSRCIYIYRNISTNGTLTTGSFAPVVILPLGTGGENAMLAADVDGDGRPDLLFLDDSLNVVAVIQNLCTPGNITTGSFGSRVNFSVGSGPLDVAVQDLDGDGRPEMVVANYSGSTISILRNIGTTGSITTNSFAPATSTATGANPLSVMIADVDGDGKPDVITANAGAAASAVSVFRNTSTLGNITMAARVDFAGLLNSEFLAIGDMDGDGKLDLVVGSASGGQAVSVFRNTSTPGSITTGSFAAHVDFAAGGWADGVAIGDLDGDGKPDVATPANSSHLSLFRNISTSGSFTSGSLAARLDFPSGSNPYGVAIGDLNGDGAPDVVFANNVSSTLSVCQNIIGIRPSITSQPASRTNLVGTTASFNVVASGSTPLTYQWKKNGINITGATSTNFSIVNVQITDAATYSVAITNAYGSVISSNAVLTVLAPPTITLQPASRTNLAGTIGTFTNVASGTLPLNYQWRKYGSAMTDGGNVSGSSTNILTLANVQDADAASYTVVVTNVVGSVTSSIANLVVFDPPIILSQPTNLTVTLTSNATFSVIASGSPVLRYQWNFNGTNIAGATNTSLTLTNVQLNQAGSYAVLVTNNYGSILSSNATLTVNPLPQS
jgi:hypothetical protein